MGLCSLLSIKIPIGAFINRSFRCFYRSKISIFLSIEVFDVLSITFYILIHFYLSTFLSFYQSKFSMPFIDRNFLYIYLLKFSMVLLIEILYILYIDIRCFISMLYRYKFSKILSIDYILIYRGLWCFYFSKYSIFVSFEVFYVLSIKVFHILHYRSVRCFEGTSFRCFIDPSFRCIYLSKVLQFYLY